MCSQGCFNTNGSYNCHCFPNFKLQSDNRTCKPTGKIDPILLYAATKSVNAFRLRTKHMYKVADNLNQVIGVSYDGSYVYWTDISAQVESVMRAKIDGSDVEVS